MRQRKPKLDRLGPAIKNAGVAMPAFIGAAYFRNFVFLGIVAKDLERAHVRAHAQPMHLVLSMTGGIFVSS